MATAAVTDAAAVTVDMAQDLATSTRDAARSATNQAQNTVTRAREEAESEDVIRIHDTGENTHHPVHNAVQYKHYVKEATRWGVAEHDVSFTGFGGVIFIVMLFALVLAMTSFAGTSWSTEPAAGEDGSVLEIGLWEECTCTKDTRNDSWFKATQAMITIGFLGSWVAMACISLYMCMCLNLIKKTFLLLGVVLSALFSALFVFIGIIVFGASESPEKTLGWSFAISLISMLLTFLAAILGVLHLRRSVAL